MSMILKYLTLSLWYYESVMPAATSALLTIEGFFIFNRFILPVFLAKCIAKQLCCCFHHGNNCVIGNNWRSERNWETSFLPMLFSVNTTYFTMKIEPFKNVLTRKFNYKTFLPWQDYTFLHCIADFSSVLQQRFHTYKQRTISNQARLNDY